MKKNPYRLRLERNFQKKKSFHTNNDGKKLNFYAVPQGFFLSRQDKGLLRQNKT